MRYWFHVAALMIAILAAPQVMAGDPTAGEVLAEAWCASCHAVHPGDATNDVAPSFDAIVNVHGRSEEFLRGWLADPHGAMPDPNLSRSETDDVVSYMETMRGE